MITGIRLKARPNATQKEILNQWMGCARYIWNAKSIEDKQQRLILNSKETKEYPPINQQYTHFKKKKPPHGCFLYLV